MDKTIGQEIIEAIKVNAYDKLRDIATGLSMGEESDKLLAMRVQLAAAIVEVTVLGDDLTVEDEDALKTPNQPGGFHPIEDAVEECHSATGELWPSRELVLAKWLFSGADGREVGEE